jgi:hypothetical protein
LTISAKDGEDWQMRLPIDEDSAFQHIRGLVSEAPKVDMLA